MLCGHEGCRCEIDDGEDYCSNHCQEHSDDLDHSTHRCECGHAACEDAQGESRTERDLQEAFE
jgi:hypothetical protein